MRYMMIYKIANTPENDSGAMPTDDEIATMGRFIATSPPEGVLLVTDGLLETSRGASVRREGDQVTVKDGPFTEAKEVVAGYAIVDVQRRTQAIELGEALPCGRRGWRVGDSPDVRRTRGRHDCDRERTRRRPLTQPAPDRL